MLQISVKSGVESESSSWTHLQHGFGYQLSFHYCMVFHLLNWANNMNFTGFIKRLHKIVIEVDEMKSS